MQFDIHLDAEAPRIDLDAVEQRLLALDPAGVVDLDRATGTLRVSTYLAEDELASLLAQAGHAVPPDRIRRLPSVCCGGCGG